MSALRFFPIVNTEKYKTWKDLDGVDMYTHARGSGTEAIMNLMPNKNGIKPALPRCPFDLTTAHPDFGIRIITL